MSRMEDFYNLFSRHIYSEEIVKNFMDVDSKKNLILFNMDKIAVNKFIIEYYLNLEKNERILSCKKCS